MPDTRLTRAWRAGLIEEAERGRRRLRWRRLILLLVLVDLVIVLAVGAVLFSVDGDGDGDDEGGKQSPDLPAFVADPERRALAPTFERWADAYGVSPALVEALAWRESQWDNSLRSPAGAMGIGQLLPETTAFVADELIGAPLDPTKPRDNIRLTTRYLRSLLDRYDGHVRTALAAYLQGATSVSSEGVTPQTAAYVREVLALRDQFARARDG